PAVVPNLGRNGLERVLHAARGLRQIGKDLCLSVGIGRRRLGSVSRAAALRPVGELERIARWGVLAEVRVLEEAADVRETGVALIPARAATHDALQRRTDLRILTEKRDAAQQ